MLLQNLKIINKFKVFEYLWIQKLTNNANLRIHKDTSLGKLFSNMNPTLSKGVLLTLIPPPIVESLLLWSTP